MSRPRVWAIGVCGLALVGAPATAAAATTAQPSNAPLATWQAQGRVSAIAISHGVVYIGGSFTSLSSHGTRRTITRNHLAAINEATGTPTAWNPNVDGPVRAIRVIGKRVYIGGAFARVGGRPVRNLAVVGRRRGRVVAGFHASANGQVTALAASARRLYIGGTFSRVEGHAHGNLAAVSLRTGALARSWTARTNGTVHTLLVDTADGRVFVGGHFSRVDGRSRPWLASLGAKRGSVFRWASPPLGQVWSVTLSPQGPLYAAVGGHQGGQLDSYHPLTGGLRWHRFADGDVQAVSVAGSTILAGGHFLNACTTNQGGGSPWMCAAPLRRNRFFATNQQGAIQSWNPNGNSLHGVWVLRSDRRHVAAGGDFTIIDGIHQARYAEFPR